MKNINDICIMVQARMDSKRVPNKMLKPFAKTTLVEILFKKLKKSSMVSLDNIYFSVYDQQLIDIARKHKINTFYRSKESAQSEGHILSELYEWHDKLPYKYVILVSACNPLLKIETIDNFIKKFIESKKEGAFSVFLKKTYYWDNKGKAITDWKDLPIMNTKFVDPIYEAAHCLYASRMDIIKHGQWMDTNYPPEPELVTVDELEAFDIDYEWQFKLGEKLYKDS